MNSRIGIAKAAAAATAWVAAAMSCAGAAQAGQPLAAGDSLSLSRPILADQAAPRKPLMNELDQVGAAKELDNAGLNIGGFIEMSWTHNFGDPSNQINTGRVFDFENDDHTLNQIDVFIEKAVAASGERFDWGGRIEWIWGGDARLIHANGVFDHYGFPLFAGSPGTGDGPDEQFDPVQFYFQANLPVGNGIVITGGKFVTLMGYETINPTTNPFYSHTYLFGFAIPFTNTGGMATYALDKNWSFSGAIVRGWDQSFEDNNGDALSYMGQIKYTTEHLDIIINGITGPEQLGSDSDYRTVADLIVVYREGDNWQLIFNADYGYESSSALDGSDGQWWGAAGYAIYKVNDMITGAARIEFFSDDDGSRGLHTQLTEITAGLTIHPFPNNQWGSGLIFRPEIRWDWATDEVFNAGDDDNQITIAGDIIYAF